MWVSEFLGKKPHFSFTFTTPPIRCIHVLAYSYDYGGNFFSQSYFNIHKENMIRIIRNLIFLTTLSAVR